MVKVSDRLLELKKKRLAILRERLDSKRGTFSKLWTSDKRYFLLTGGRGSLKSTSVHRFVIQLCAEEAGHGVLFTRYTMKSAEKSIIPEFEIVLNRLGVRNEWNVTRDKATHKETGSFIYFSGIKTSSGDQTANLKSIAGVTTWVIEEGEDFKSEKVFDTIDDSIRTSDLKNRIIWIQNPTTKEHFIYKRFIAPKNKKQNFHGYDVTVSDLDNVEHIHSTYHIAAKRGFLSDSWLGKIRKSKEKAEKAENKYKTHYYFNYIGGWLEKAEGVIFENWEEGKFDDSLPYCRGLDLGFFPDPLAMIKIAVDERNKKIYLKEEIYQTNLTNEAIEVLLGQILEHRTDLIVSDTNEPRLIKYLKERKFNIQKAKKGKNSIVDTIRDMLDYQVIVDPDSTNLKTEFNNYVWNDKKASIPIDAFNHLIDAARYGFKKLKRNKNPFGRQVNGK